ncbi:hypothetical protein ElyMa_002022000 [Elysia marginata]|uniref:Homeobox domain-containing protein n=1 Tax=Elysia marginata TaxID=1093978 RepID=A0AAV4F5J3_9GAST|nr:hypothetical protein ElyMa_002022000 [Elysia marginata]
MHHHHHIQHYQQHHQQQQQQQQHHHQFPQHHWGYGMNGGDIRAGSAGEEWGHGYYFHHQANGYHAQNPYGCQYRAPQHPGLDYGSPLSVNNEADRHNGTGHDDSPSPRSDDEDGDGGVDAPGCGGPNNQGAKSLRPPYEWMKPSPALPQPGELSSVLS